MRRQRKLQLWLGRSGELAEKRNYGAIRFSDIEESTLGQTATEREHDGLDREDEFLPEIV